MKSIADPRHPVPGAWHLHAQTAIATLAGAVGMTSRMGMAGAASGDSRVRVNPLMTIARESLRRPAAA